MKQDAKIIVAFYASTRYGSEYRAGLEFIQLAARVGFDLAVVADLEQNDSPERLSAAAGGISVVAIASVLRRQRALYRFTDFLPQIIWHHRVARWLAKHHPGVDVLWVQNGAQPWLPISPYFRVARTLIWGPIGGGEPPPPEAMRSLSWPSRARERLRTGVEAFALRRKLRLLNTPNAPRVVALARTVEARLSLRQLFPEATIPVIPEILEPVRPVRLSRKPQERPRFLWVGQDIARKNLPLALAIFARLRAEAFPGATLDVFGVSGRHRATLPGVCFHGWVPRIEWENYRHDGVLLLTSFREGLPSAVLEAVTHGLLCVTSEVGALSSLQLATVHTLPRAEYPQYSGDTFRLVVDRIRCHLSADEIALAPVSHRDNLLTFLRANGVN